LYNSNFLLIFAPHYLLLMFKAKLEMKTKLFLAAVAVAFSFAVTSCGNKKAANTFCKDVFAFFVLKDEILAHQLDNCNLNSAGWGCSSYIIRNGNMKYLHKK